MTLLSLGILLLALTTCVISLDKRGAAKAVVETPHSVTITLNGGQKDKRCTDKIVSKDCKQNASHGAWRYDEKSGCEFYRTQACNVHLYFGKKTDCEKACTEKPSSTISPKTSTVSTVKQTSTSAKPTTKAGNDDKRCSSQLHSKECHEKPANGTWRFFSDTKCCKYYRTQPCNMHLHFTTKKECISSCGGGTCLRPSKGNFYQGVSTTQSTTTVKPTTSQTARPTTTSAKPKTTAVRQTTTSKPAATTTDDDDEDEDEDEVPQWPKSDVTVEMDKEPPTRKPKFTPEPKTDASKRPRSAALSALMHIVTKMNEFFESILKQEVATFYGRLFTQGMKQFMQFRDYFMNNAQRNFKDYLLSLAPTHEPESSRNEDISDWRGQMWTSLYDRSLKNLLAFSKKMTEAQGFGWGFAPTFKNNYNLVDYLSRLKKGYSDSPTYKDDNYNSDYKKQEELMKLFQFWSDFIRSQNIPNFSWDQSNGGMQEVLLNMFEKFFQ